MSTNQKQLAKNTLIIGCGYLGNELVKQLRLLNLNYTITGTVRGQSSAQKLMIKGVKPLFLEVTQPLTFAAIHPAVQCDELDVYYMVPPGRNNNTHNPTQTVIEGITNTIKYLNTANIRKAILVSSTAVYGQNKGQTINANTPAIPFGNRSKILHEGEKIWLSSGKNFHVLRLAGIYGPKRIIGLAAVRNGSPIIGNPQALLNLIHVEDAASLLISIMHSDTAGQIELGCDGNTISRQDYYNSLAKLISVPPPQVLSTEEAVKQFGLYTQRLQNTPSRSLSNALTCERTGWSPKHTNFISSIKAILLKQRNNIH